MDNKPKKSEPPKQKKYFDVRLEVMVPALLTYRVYAYNEEEALEQANKQPPNHIKPNVRAKRNIKATVSDSGSSIIKFVKRFI